MKYRLTKGGSNSKLEINNDGVCQICDSRDLNTIIDGRTKAGRWAWMCETCHSIIGVGFGVGFGQRFDRIGFIPESESSGK